MKNILRTIYDLMIVPAICILIMSVSVWQSPIDIISAIWSGIYWILTGGIDSKTWWFIIKLYSFLFFVAFPIMVTIIHIIKKEN